MHYKIWRVLAILISFTFFGEAFDNFDTVKRWLEKEVYNSKATMRDAYTGKPFVKGADGKLRPIGYNSLNPNNLRAKRMEWEHIVPAENFGRQIKECRDSKGNFIGRVACAKVSAKFKKMLSDPINIVPTNGEINNLRSNYRFAEGEIPKDSPLKKYGMHIDKEAKKVYVSGRKKGEIARAYLHMNKEYGMKLSKKEKEMFERWDKLHPPTLREKRILAKKKAMINKYNNTRRVAKNTRVGSTTISTSDIAKNLKKVAPKTPKAILNGITKLTNFAKVAGRVIAPILIITTAIDAYNLYNKVVGTYEQVYTNKEDIERNLKKIELNRDLIDALDKEQKILGVKVDKNSRDISGIFGRLSQHEGKFAQIDSKFLAVSQEIGELKGLIEKNRKEIDNIKNGIFKTAMSHLINSQIPEIKTETKKDNLREAILMLETSKNIKNQAVKSLAEFYLGIAEYELYKITNEPLELEKAKESFLNLAKEAKQNPKILPLLNTLYLGLMDSSKVDEFREILTKTTKEAVSNLIAQKKFDLALDSAKSYIKIIDSSESNPIYQMALKAREENYQKYKNFGSIDEAIEIISKNDNSLLNEAVIKYLYKENALDKALELLRDKRVDEYFRMKAFLAIYRYKGDKQKVEEIKDLIKSHQSYPKRIRELVN